MQSRYQILLMKKIFNAISLLFVLASSIQAQTETSCPQGLSQNQCGKCYMGERISSSSNTVTTSDFSLQNTSTDDWMVTRGTVQLEAIPLAPPVKIDPSKIDASFSDSLVFFKDEEGKDVALIFSKTASKVLKLRYSGVSVDKSTSTPNADTSILLTRITFPIRVWDFDKKKVVGSFSQFHCIFSKVQ